MRHLIALLVLLFFHQLPAQTLTDFTSGSLDMGDLGIDRIIDFAHAGDSYFFVVNADLNTTEFHTSIIQTDEDFNILKRVDNLEGVLKFLHFDGDNGYCLLGRNHKINDENSYEILSMDLSTFQVSLTDFLINEPNTEIINWVHKQIRDSTILAVGHLLDYNNGYAEYMDQYIMELTLDGKITDLKSLGLTSEETGSIKDFIYLPTLEAYLLAPHGPADYFILLDKDYEIKQLIPNEVTFISKHNSNSEAYQWPTEVSLLHAAEDTVHCLGGMFFQEHCYMVHIKLPIYEDSIGGVVNYQVDGLFEKSVATTRFNGPFVNWKTVNGTFDSRKNAYITLGSVAQIYSPTVMDTSSIYIAKTNLKDYNYQANEWFIEFPDDADSLVNNSDILIWGTSVDAKDNLIIYGEYRKEEFKINYPPTGNYGSRNFYLKIDPNGIVTASSGPIPKEMLVIYPNPTDGPLTVKSEEGEYSRYRVYDVQGQLLKEDNMLNDKFNIRDLYPGTYFIHFLNQEGKVIGSSKVVKY